ncbi:hypothetical protein FD755_016001, partial [Muntiacus reevesi]
TLCDPMDCSTPGSFVLHCLSELHIPGCLALAAISLMPDVDGTGSGSLLDSILSTLLKNQSSDRCNGSSGLQSEWLLQPLCTVLRLGPVTSRASSNKENPLAFSCVMNSWTITRASLVAQLVKNLRRPEFDPWIGKIPWRRKRLPTPVFWPGEFHGLCSPWGRKDLHTEPRALKCYDRVLNVLNSKDISNRLFTILVGSRFYLCFTDESAELFSLASRQPVTKCLQGLRKDFPNLTLRSSDRFDDLERFMENQGASSPGILILTTSLSKPFMRLEKYVTLLQELERHMEDTHPDHQDILKAIIAFKTLMGQCQDLRKRKQLELQILSEPIQAWEGDDIKTLGNVIFMSQVMVQCGTSEEKEERYLMLFSSVLIMLSASPRMSGFIYQGKIPIAGMVVTRLDEIEGNDSTFEITGNIVERIVVHCSNNQDFQDWLEHLYRLIRGPASCSSLSKTSSSSCSAHSSFSSTGQPRGPLEPPQIIKPWSLSCLRPAPPLRPSAALGYKERMSYILKESSKSPKTMKKFLHKRKTERKPSEEEYVIRKSTAALEEDAQILKVIEAYCTSASFPQGHASSARKDSIPQVLLPEEEKLIVEETRSNGQTIIEEKSLVDTVYALKDEVKELKQENKRMKQCLEEELKSRRDLEKLVRRLLKQTDECIRAESSSKTSILP